MRFKNYVPALLVTMAGACSARGVADPPQPDTEDLPSEAGAPLAEAGPPEDAARGADADADAERPLVCGDAGFCETRLPTSEHGVPLSLRGIWAVSADDAWSVTAEGYVLHYDGASWHSDHRVSHELHAVWASPTSVWVGGENGLLLHRDAAGTWSHVESGHIAPIRWIYGESDDDVWFTREEVGSVDHFDGQHLTNRAIDVPGLRITTLFGRPGLGAFAAGYVPPSTAAQRDRGYLFALSKGEISIFNTKLQAQAGFVPTSGAVYPSADDGPNVALIGNLMTRLPTITLQTPSWYSVGEVDMSSRRTAPASEGAGDLRSRPTLGLIYDEDDIWMVRHVGWIHRWNGSPSLVPVSIAMGYDFAPKFIFAAHANDSNTWLVGDGFALKGVTP